MQSKCNFFRGLILLLAILNEVQPLCVLESDFGFKINCAFKKSGLFRVRNLGGIKAHASLGFSLGDELGFDQSLTNQDPSRRRSVSLKNGAPNILVDTSNVSAIKQEKRGKQNRIMMRPVAPVNRPNQAAMDKLSTLHRRVATTMQPIVVAGPTVETSPYNRPQPTVTMAKPLAMGVPPFRPLPPKEDTLKVVPVASQFKKKYSPLQLPQNGPAVVYPNNVPHQVHDLANAYQAYNTKKVDDYNTINGYSDDTALKFNKEDIDAKIAEIAKVGNISMEAVEAAIALRQQQILNKYANIAIPTTTTTTARTTTTEEAPVVFQLEPEPEIVVAPVPQKPKRNPTGGKVMNAPKEYYPVGYEKNFDDHFQSKVDLPETNFHCGDQKYFPGLYGDESLGCMVFHVCALTDDGLVMKSFLCPESTLFDQTILKCNWWFYVDCKNTMKLYDTNIPVSKSYQLMKALTFFSSYKKELEEKPMNPEDMQGVKEAITILENQDAKPAPSNTVQQIFVTPTVDERHNKQEHTSTLSPVYRGSRNFNNGTENKSNRNQNTQNNAGIKVNMESAEKSTTEKASSFADRTSSAETSSERRIRQRFVSRKSSSTTKPTSTSILPKTNPVTSTTTTTIITTILPNTTTEKTIEVTTSPITPQLSTYSTEIRSLPTMPINSTEINEMLTDQVETLEKMDASIVQEAESLPPVKRFYRSSAENHSEKEIETVNNERVQIIRPTSTAQLVGEYLSPTATIAKLDEAVLGRPLGLRIKKAVSVLLPNRYNNAWRPLILDES